MMEVEKTLKKFFRDNPKSRDNPELRGGKIPIGQLYKVLGERNQNELKDYLKKLPIKEPNATKLRLFKMGHLIENYLIGLMNDGALDIKNEQLVLENDFLKGRIDFTITDSGGKTYICDIKSMNDVNYGLLLHDAVADYIKVQLMCYIWLWRQTRGEPIEDEALILAYNKNDSRVKTYVIGYDQSFIDTYLIEAKRFYKKNNLGKKQ